MHLLYVASLSTDSFAEQYQPFSEITRSSLVHALKEHSRELNEPAIEDLMKAYDSLSIFPDVAPTLDKLSSNPDIECVVFSNGTKTMVSNSVTKSEELSPFASVFRNLITVDFIRSFKPAPEVYKYLAQRVERVGKENEMWLVSGNPFDVVGARAVGMQAAWVDRAGHGWQDMLGGEPTVVVRSLEEVADVVAKHANKKQAEIDM
jgi:2-haloacid dehalogenase